MDRTGSPTGMRAAALAVALLAITLNFLQPLAHAALMRDGMPGALWSVFCNSAAADPDGKSGPATPAPGAAHDHECCLGLAHAPAAIAPSSEFIALSALSANVSPLLPSVQLTPVGIRDGPASPRGPPSDV